MLGYTVSHATVSRYLPAPGRGPTQSSRSFLRNQASAFGHYSEARSGGYAGLHVAKLLRSTTAQVAAVGIGLKRGFGRRPSAANARKISLRDAQCGRDTMHRVPRLAAVFVGLQQACGNRLPIAVAVRSHPLKVGPRRGLTQRANRDIAFLVGQVLRSHRGLNPRNPFTSHKINLC